MNESVPNDRKVGTVVHLQVQRASLKVWNGQKRHYDPDPLFAVDWLELADGGVNGGVGHGSAITDVHHRDHVESKNSHGANGISIGFVTHYERMRQRFGSHMTDGIAGENILIATGARFIRADLPEQLIIEAADGRSATLHGIQVADPCVEFTRFALQLSHDAPNDGGVAEALAFLRHGMRGYYARYQGPPIRIMAGDCVRLVP